MLPFSRMRPPMIPASAKPIPARVARSGRTPGFGFGLMLSGEAAGAALGSGFFAMESLAAGISDLPHPLVLQHPAAELEDAFDDLVRALQDAQYLTVGQRNHRIGRDIDVLD